MKCVNCGSEMPVDSKFCTRCGAALEPPVAAQPTEVQPPIAPLADMQPSPPVPPKKKRRVWKAVVAVVAVLLLAGAVGGGVWYYMDQKRQADVEAAANEARDQAKAEADAAAQAEAEKAEEEKAAREKAEEGKAAKTESAKDGDASKEDDQADFAHALVGTWTGKLTSTSSSIATGHSCYGAQEHPLELTVKSVDGTGKVKAKVTVLYHGHSSRLGSDVDTSDGDVVQTFDDLVGTNKGGRFTLDIDESDIGSGCSMEIEAKFDEQYSTGAQVKATVQSVCDGAPIRDEFTLTKQK